ncbi:MAG: DMT family transporter [bacterium]
MINFALIFPIISFIAYGLLNATSKPFVQKTSPMVYLFYRGLGVTAVNLIIVIFTWKSLVFDPKTIIIGAIVSAISYIGLYAFTKGIEKGKVGVVVPLSSINVLITIFIAMLIFGEKLHLISILAILILFMGVVLSSIDFQEIRKIKLLNFQEGIPQSLIAGVVWGITFAFFGKFSSVLGAYLFSLILEGSVFLCILVHISFQKINPLKDWSIVKHNLPLYLITIISCVAGTLGMNLGFYYLNVSLVSAIKAASPLVSILYARSILKEKLSVQQWLSAILIVGGVVMLSYFG